jgi:hypothetical protein
VTLDRLVLAWLPVAVLFAVAPPASFNRWELGWRAAEAAVVTLFASLWFDTLGAGGWGVLFFLVGLLVAFPRRLVTWQHIDAPGRHDLLVHAGVDVARYVAAGGLLAWRLA